MSDISYAVVECAGRQMRVSEGDVILLDEGIVGKKVDLDSVVALRSPSGLKVGDPYIKGAKVTAVVGEEVKGPKISVVKYKKRKDSKRKIGHRQRYFSATVESIKA
jgi:large subunit ribosomal protein L21